ncbi:MAG: hypothetical protein Q9196_006370, partial [Gyalolechia fulgens]
MPDGFFDAAPQEFPPSACCSGHVYHNRCVPARRFNVLKAREDTDAPCLPSNNCGINDKPPKAALKALMDRETPCVALNNCDSYGDPDTPESSSETPEPASVSTYHCFPRSTLLYLLDITDTSTQQTTTPPSVTYPNAPAPPLLDTHTPPNLLPPKEKRNDEFTTHLP